MLRYVLVFLLAGAALAAPKTQTSLHTRKAHSEAHLVVSHETVVAGGQFRAGLFIEPDEGWHVYWQNPGDSGAAPILNWKAPTGIAVKSFDYPFPSRYEKSGLVAFGYQEGVLYSSIFDVSENYSASTITLTLDAEWLVCKEICIPARHRFQTSVKIGPEKLYDRYRSLFDRFLGRLPHGEKLVEIHEGSGRVVWDIPNLGSSEIIDFFPARDVEIKFSKPEFQASNGKLSFDVQRTSAKPFPQELGVLIYREAFEGPAVAVTLVQGAHQSPMVWWRALLLALGGGMLLNLMPCVFPVLSIKVLSLTSQSAIRKREIRKTNLIYAAGIIVGLTLLGGVLATLRSAGEALGWGFQLQTPWFLVAMTYLFMVMGFVFLGSLDLSRLNVSYGQSLAAQEGWLGEFFSGFLCVLVASPCTAPFMGAALGFAVTQPLPIFLSVFLALGLGLASPYLVLSFFPTLVKFLPRPGAWMETLKEAMAFPLFMTVLWLIWVYGQIQGVTSSFLLTTAHLILAMAVWAVSRKKLTRGLRIFASVLLVTSLFVSVQSLRTVSETVATAGEAQGISWQKYSEATLQKLIQAGKPVFIDFTADWCLTCKVNERLTFSSDAVKKRIDDLGIQMLKADWTRRDPEVTRALEKYGRIGVPFYVAYSSAEKNGKPLGEVMTPDIFLEVFQMEVSEK